jgi:hypothetical protein
MPDAGWDSFPLNSSRMLPLTICGAVDLLGRDTSTVTVCAGAPPQAWAVSRATPLATRS